jgi:hypothetical protein
LVSACTEFLGSRHYIHYDQSTVIATGCYVTIDRRERDSVDLDSNELVTEHGV